ncbi:hypothetical protein P8C59_000965 [Phyllachora maydis]|uniref:Uncharacterized protein n=1 Tax=Phyllachora maydis TaxID=1825666 RepID=A0AAD9HXI0_9PEZI|nr:hypothetical protein P8C59_000965 [Phyllachora maydis]
MYIYIACLPYRCYCCDSSFANLLIANVDSFSNLDDSVYTILAACKAKRRELAKACRSKRTASSNAGRYTTNSSFMANKDDNNAYNRAYMPPVNAEEEEDSSSDDNGVNSGTSDSADKGEGGGTYERSKSALRREDMPLYKRQYVVSYPCGPPSAPCTDIYVYYV